MAFQVVAYYPITAARRASLPPDEFPADCYVVSNHGGNFRSAKAACARWNRRHRNGGVVAVIHDGYQEIRPNRYGRYEGYE